MIGTLPSRARDCNREVKLMVSPIVVDSVCKSVPIRPTTTVLVLTPFRI